ncbi:hypothetical protein C7999DRAFT_27911 [Corynascus novoguineensis]|uniref:RING-type domain-containing protein n=1 Tax=Corynascus novoguineensis TaxID=1126955 RepID=A0AAN7HU85_9PEZI|nr:hypothetical protein C7999DRAFT_27911 [Corynascus novoguineensis]
MADTSQSEVPEDVLAQECPSRAKVSGEGVGCFVPDPAYTFLFADPLPDLFCVICQDTKLVLHDHLSPESLEESVEDETPNPCLLVCGHVFCARCCIAWLRSESYSGRCPVCRFELRFKRCGHTINPIKLYPETVLFIAELKTGGSGVPDACTICTSIERLEAATLLCKPLARTYYKLKREFDEDGSDESRALMLKAKKVLDGVKEAMQPALRRC